jgi:hypothetical protein
MRVIGANGKIYEDVPTAAKKLGITKSAVYTALSRGRAPGAGQGKGQRPNWCGGRPIVPVKIGPFEWPSYAAAARALDVDQRWLRKVVTSGGQRAKANLLRKVMEYQATLERKPCR